VYILPKIISTLATLLQRNLQIKILRLIFNYSNINDSNKIKKNSIINTLKILSFHFNDLLVEFINNFVFRTLLLLFQSFFTWTNVGGEYRVREMILSIINEGENFILIRVYIKLRTCGKQLRSKGIFVFTVLTVGTSKNTRMGKILTNQQENSFIAALMSFETFFYQQD